MHTLLAIRSFLHQQWVRALQQPAECLIKPGVKAVVLIAMLTGAAQWTQERAGPKKTGVKQAAQVRAGKAPPAHETTGSTRR
jgi:hypothetical protein